ncbi:MAG: PfkB family carbohydrate kinase, partial [Caulobacteraceae bacterium]
GAPGGAAVAPETFEDVLGGVRAQGLFGKLDAVLTGHFSSGEQVEATARALAAVKAARPQTRIVVDPVMGDEDKGLYVREAVAEALVRRLVPLADILTPNAWELARLTGRPLAANPADALADARSLGRPALVSSVRARDGALATLWVDGAEAWLASHARRAAAPKGTGDLLAAAFVAGLVEGLGPQEALAAAVGAAAEAVFAAGDLDELPVDALPTRLHPSPRVRVRAL